MNEQIEMYRAVQKYRGEWQLGDWLLYQNTKTVVVSLSQEDGDIEIYIPGEYDGFYYLCAWCKPDDPDLLWITPPTPRWPGDDEKRTLWGMVDWEKWDLRVHDDGTCSMLRFLKVENDYDAEPGNNSLIAIAEHVPLPEALLRAAVGKGDKS